MADKTLEQMLEHLVNNEQEKAEELFHEYVVAKSREIYETLIESEVENDEVEEADEKDEEDAVEEADEKDEDAVEEADEKDEEEVSEELSDDDFLEADDETDALAGALEEPMDDEEGEVELDSEGEEEIFQDLEAIIDELQSKFDELKGHEEDEGELDDEEEGEEMPFGGDDEEEMKDDFDVELATVREYVEKIGAPNNADTADNKTSTIDNMKNDMGGTTANILSSKGEETGRTADKPKVEDLGNINQPGGMKSDKMMSKESGGAASSESGADNTDSLFRGKRS